MVPSVARVYHTLSTATLKAKIPQATVFSQAGCTTSGIPWRALVLQEFRQICQSLFTKKTPLACGLEEHDILRINILRDSQSASLQGAGFVPTQFSTYSTCMYLSYFDLLCVIVVGFSAYFLESQ